MNDSKGRRTARTKSPLVSILALSSWIAIIGCCGYQGTYAFAFTKIPNTLLDERHAHQDRRNRHTTLRSPVARHKYGNASGPIGRNKNKATKPGRSLSAAEANLESPSSSDGEINKGRAILGLVAILLGTLNVSLRFVYDVPEIPPTAAALSATRGWLAFLCFLPPLFLGNQKAKQSREGRPPPAPKLPLFRSGTELAVWGFLSQGMLNVGLVTTGSARAAFLTQTSVLFTPLLSTSIGKQSIGRNVWSACVVALLGLVVLTVGASSGGGAAAAGAASSAFSLALSRGDLFVLGGAVSWSMYMFRISSLGSKHPDLVLQGVKTGLMAILYSTWWIVSTAMNSPGGVFRSLFSLPLLSSIPSWMKSSPVVWIALFFSAIGPGTVADVLQQKAQKSVSATEANILLSAEPVFATIFAVLLLGEKSSLLEIFGGGLILVAAMIASA